MCRMQTKDHNLKICMLICRYVRLFLIDTNIMNEYFLVLKKSTFNPYVAKSSVFVYQFNSDNRFMADKGNNIDDALSVLELCYWWCAQTKCWRYGDSSWQWCRASHITAFTVSLCSFVSVRRSYKNPALFCTRSLSSLGCWRSPQSCAPGQLLNRYSSDLFGHASNILLNNEHALAFLFNGLENNGCPIPTHPRRYYWSRTRLIVSLVFHWQYRFKA